MCNGLLMDDWHLPVGTLLAGKHDELLGVTHHESHSKSDQHDCFISNHDFCYHQEYAEAQWGQNT